MSLNSRPQPRPMNPPPADAFTNYRPTAPPTQQQQQQAAAGGPGVPPQRNNSGGSTSAQPPQGERKASASGGGGSKPPPLTLEQSREVARTHWTALKGWLAKEGALASGSTRTNAREKLTRLTRQQFQELSTDVYDELVRRMEDASGRPGEQPFLAVRSDFHPKRNQARQKLATLPLLRFRDLASDVYFELDRRYPEFAEEEDNPDGQGFSPSPGANTPTTPYGTALSHSSQPHSRSGSLASQNNNNNNNGMASPPLPSNLNARRAPTPQQQQSSHSPQQSQAYSQHSHGSSPSGGSSNPPPSAGIPAGNDVVVPNKSTMIVEDDPPAPSSRPPFGGGGNNSYGRSSPAPVHSNPTSPASETGPSPEDRRGSIERSLSPSSGGLNFGAGGRSLLASPPLGGGSSRSGAGDSEDAAEELAPPSARGMRGEGEGGMGGKGGQHQSMASETSSIGTRFFGGYAGSAAASEAGGRRSWDYDPSAVEKVKSEYEYKLTMLQNRVSELERENDDAAAALKGRRGDEERVRELEREVREGRERFDNQASQLRSLQRDHDTLRASSSRSPPSTSSSTASDAHLRTRLHEAEELANELRGEVSSLVDEIRQVNERCDELQRELEREREERERVEKESEGWKGRWQQVKLELRNIKATSQLFSSSISVDADYMPASSDGLIKDTSVAAFQTSIDDLLQAARSKEPSSVLPAARTVVSACEKLDNDIQAIPQNRLASLPPSDQDLVNSLKAKVNATLSNLMTASKNHAMSFGVSPVSLLDAAASHLAATIVELVRVLKIRRTTGGSRSSLDPSAAFGFGRSAGGLGHGLSSHSHDPMPPLPENMQPLSVQVPTGPPEQHRDPSPDVGPAPPAKERSAEPKKQEEEPKKEKSPGYLSGGMSSLLGGGAGSVTKALEAMGISSGKRASVDSQDERKEPSQPASSQQPQQQQQPSRNQQPTPTRESFAFSDMSLDSSARASPIPPASGAGGAPTNDYHQQQHLQQQPHQRYDSHDQQSQQQQDASAYPQYGQGLARDISNSSLAYRTDSPPPRQDSYNYQSQQRPQDGRYSPYGAGGESARNGGGGEAAYEYGSDRRARGQEQYGQSQYGQEDEQETYKSPALNRSERNPEELRAYIENQTEAIVHSIQSLLSAIRSGAQGSELTDNLTQIITIVSSIVAISQAALPNDAREEGNAILDDLTTHCDKLSEMQNGGNGGNGADAFTKQTKQAMAAASFGVAKSLKQLNSLLQGQGEEGLV